MSSLHFFNKRTKIPCVFLPLHFFYIFSLSFSASSFHRVWHAVNQKMRKHETSERKKNLFIFDVLDVYCTSVHFLRGIAWKVDTKVKRSRKKLKNTLWIIYFVIISKRMKEICGARLLQLFLRCPRLMAGKKCMKSVEVASRVDVCQTRNELQL